RVDSLQRRNKGASLRQSGLSQQRAVVDTRLALTLERLRTAAHVTEIGLWLSARNLGKPQRRGASNLAQPDGLLLTPSVRIRLGKPPRIVHVPRRIRSPQRLFDSDK